MVSLLTLMFTTLISTYTHATQPSNAGNSGNIIEVTAYWTYQELELWHIPISKSHLSPGCFFEMSFSDANYPSTAVITAGPPRAECHVGTFPYEGGNEFTSSVPFQKPTQAIFFACKVVEGDVGGDVENGDGGFDGLFESRSGDGDGGVEEEGLDENDEWMIV